MTKQTHQAIDALLAWLCSAEARAADHCWRAQLLAAVDACDDDHVALCALLERLEHSASHIACSKWRQLVAELQRLHEGGELLDHPAVTTQLQRLKPRFPAADTVVQIDRMDKRLSAPILRTANSLEVPRPPQLERSASRALRRALTGDDPDRQFPVLERPTTPQRSGTLVASSLTKSFMYRLSFVLQANVEETFFCFICFENAPITQAFALSLCGHQFCRDCLQLYLEIKIRDGHVYPSCFHDVDDDVTGKRVACAAPIIPPDIEAVVSAAAWTKYERFKFHKEFEHARQCPYCAHSQVCRGPEYPECVCEKCKRAFCFTHSSAHNGGTCADFERQHLEMEKLNRSAIATIARACPGCGSNVEKTGGCNHMTCIACHTSFCWICGQVVDNVALPDHFAWWNIGGCAGQQLVDVEHQTLAERVGWWLFRVLFLVVCVPIATLITLVLTVLTGCCLPCVCWIHEDPTELFLGTVNTVAVYVQLLIAVVVVGPVSLLAICLRGCFRTCCCCWAPQLPNSFVERDATSVVMLGNDYELAQDDAIDL